MAMHDDLATLFSRNLSLNNPPYVPPKAEEPAKVETPYVYSITQHYHHSAHVAKEPPQEQPRHTSEPPPTDQLTVEIILSRHGVDVTSLFPSQIELFKTADASQQMRLIELWRICPPDYGGHALTQDIGNWPTTTFQQEEAMAKLRYERQMLEERMSRAGGDAEDVDAMSDGSANTPLTPIQGGDGRWNNTAEPYMASGYELLAQREYEQSAQPPAKDVYNHFGVSGPAKDVYNHFGVGGHSYNQATDPVYQKVEGIHFHNVTGDWSKLIEQKQAMENQYGAFQNFQHNNGFMAGGNTGEDEEML